MVEFENRAEGSKEQENSRLRKTYCPAVVTTAEERLGPGEVQQETGRAGDKRVWEKLEVLPRLETRRLKGRRRSVKDEVAVNDFQIYSKICIYKIISPIWKLFV